VVLLLNTGLPDKTGQENEINLKLKNRRLTARLCAVTVRSVVGLRDQGGEYFHAVEWRVFRYAMAAVPITFGAATGRISSTEAGVESRR
jgi:hypothetical protein